MPDNNIYGVDFIARCMAAEALENGGNSWTLVAGNNISILSDEEEKTETISAEIEVDGALSTTSENPVQNKVITNTLKTKPTSVDTSGNPINDQKIMALTRAQYNAIQNKDPNTYYMITDDPVPQTTPILRTGYTSVLDDYTSSYDSDGNWILTFEPKVNFEKLDVYLQWHFDWSAGTDWPVSTATRSIMLSLTKDVPGPVVSTGMNIYLANSVTQPNNPNSNILYDVLMGSINVNYDAQTNTVRMLVAKPMMVAISDPNQDKNNIPVAMTNCVANAFGYVAYGSDDYIIYDGLQAGTGINLNDDVVSIDPDYVPSDVSANITTSGGASYLTVQLEDGNGLPMGDGSTVMLPSGGGGGSFTQVQSDWTQTNSSSVDFIRNKPDLSDMATRTWVGQQGYLTSADEVPTVGSSDNNKILKATYSGGVGSYSWQPNIQAGNGLQKVGNFFEVENPVPEVIDKERCVLVTIPETDSDYGDPSVDTKWLKLRAGHVEYDETAGEDVIVDDVAPGSVLTWTGEEIQWEAASPAGGSGFETDWIALDANNPSWQFSAQQLAILKNCPGFEIEFALTDDFNDAFPAFFGSYLSDPEDPESVETLYVKPKNDNADKNNFNYESEEYIGHYYVNFGYENEGGYGEPMEKLPNLENAYIMLNQNANDVENPYQGDSVVLFKVSVKPSASGALAKYYQRLTDKHQDNE